MFAPKAIALCALLSAAAATFVDEVQWNAYVPHVALDKRQSSSTPEIQKPGDNCTVAFGAGYETCRAATATEVRLCFNPSLGQVCCQNEWGCPAESYCLVKDICCPTGVSQAECASHFSVTLPAGPLTTSGAAPIVGSGADSTTFVSTVVTTTPVSTFTTTPTLLSTSTAVPFPAGNATQGLVGSSASGGGYRASATGAGVPSGTVGGGAGVGTGAPVPFEGAAGSVVDGVSILGGAVGVMVAALGLL